MFSPFLLIESTADAELFEELGIRASASPSLLSTTSTTTSTTTSETQHTHQDNHPVEDSHSNTGSTSTSSSSHSRARIAHQTTSTTSSSSSSSHSLTSSDTSCFHYITTIPRAITSQAGKFIDNEHVHVYYIITDLEPHQLTLQVEEVEKTIYVDIDQYPHI